MLMQPPHRIRLGSWFIFFFKIAQPIVHMQEMHTSLIINTHAASQNQTSPRQHPASCALETCYTARNKNESITRATVQYEYRFKQVLHPRADAEKKNTSSQTYFHTKLDTILIPMPEASRAQLHRTQSAHIAASAARARARVAQCPARIQAR